MGKFNTVFFSVFLAAASALSACAGFHGRLAPPAPDAPDVYELIAEHENYDVYFAGRAIHMPTALVFDPREDDRKLVFHEYWMTVKDPALMKEVVKWMSLDNLYRPSLYEIFGKDGEFYGYMYGNETGVPMNSPAPGILRLGNMHPTRWDFISNEF